MRQNSKRFAELREFLNIVPVIDTHEHYSGIIEPVDDVLSLIADDYYTADLNSAAFDLGREFNRLFDLKFENLKAAGMSFQERYNIFAKLYARSGKTAYAEGIRRGLKKCWNIDSLDEKSLLQLADSVRRRNQQFYENAMDASNIVLQIVDHKIEPYLQKEKQYTSRCRFTFRMTSYMDIKSYEDIKPIEKFTDFAISNLIDYSEAIRSIYKKSKNLGIVCMKNQSAYSRKIDFSNQEISSAERVFDQIIRKPDCRYSEKEVKPLNDWLFHYMVDMASEFNLPVQIHTGHVHGQGNDIRNANAINLVNVLELHPDVQFDLFHGNWPYMGELLFLAKNYPNVWINLCWVQIIDPLYSIELMKRALVTVPHSKIIAFGGDTRCPELAVGYLDITLDNLAYALTDMIENCWLNMKEARQISADWLFNNPNRLFKLGFPEYIA